MTIAMAPVAAAQTSSAESAVAQAREAYGPPPNRPKCPTVQEGDEIVVCAEEQDQSQFRIRSDDQAENDYARATMDKGAPRAPDVAGAGIFRGPATVGSLCLPGLQKCPPPPAYIIDFDDLPDTPPGSDADRVGQGLAPTGDDAGSVPAPASSGTPIATVPAEPVSPPESASPAEAPSGSATPPAGQAPG